MCSSLYFNWHSIVLLTFFAPATSPSIFSEGDWDQKQGKKRITKRQEFLNVLESFLDKHLPLSVVNCYGTLAECLIA